MQKFWHILSTIALGAVTYGTPAIKTFIGLHPISAIVAGVGWTILGNLLPAPVAWLTKKAS